MRFVPTLIVVLFLAINGLSAAPTGLRVAIYSGTGAAADQTLALYRAVAAIGHAPLAITNTVNRIVTGLQRDSPFPADPVGVVGV